MFIWRNCQIVVIYFYFILSLKNICLNTILVMAHGIFVCGMQALNWGMWGIIPWPGIERGPPALGLESLSHWITRKSLPNRFWKRFFHFPFLPTVCENLNSSTSSSCLIWLVFLLLSHSYRYVLVFFCGFNLNFLTWQMTLSIFSCFYFPSLCFILVMSMFISFAPLKILDCSSLIIKFSVFFPF